MPDPTGISWTGIGQALSSLVNLLSHLFSWLPTSPAKALRGTYLGEVHDPGRKAELQISDVVVLKPSGRRSLKGGPIFNHYADNRYTMSLTCNPNHANILQGTWVHKTESIYFGGCMFRRHNNGGTTVLAGHYLGPALSGDIRNAPWVLRKISDEYFNYFSKRKGITRTIMRRLGRTSDLRVQEDLLTSMIQKHVDYFNHEPAPFLYEGLNIQIPPKGFNPKFGKISQKLIAYVVENEDLKSRSALDIGTGSGFYALVLGKAGASSVVGIDVNRRTIEIAAQNERKNRALIGDCKIEFRSNNGEGVYKGLRLQEKFDLIVANFPFTNTLSAAKHKSSPFYCNFVTTEEILFDLIMGAKIHLRAKGSFYLSFGRSGYTQAFEHFLDCAGLERTAALSLDQPDEHFVVYKLTHKNRS
jgi:predicted RNA methylase